MKRTLLFLIFYFLILLQVYAQVATGEIKGYVREFSTNQPLPYANIVIIGTNIGASTDLNGYYIIKNVPVNTYQLKASIIGFKSITRTDVVVLPGKLTEVNFYLSPETVQLGEVEVKANYFLENYIEPVSINYFNNEEIRRSPGGFEDVIRALSILPGVSQVDAGRNDLIVRGGAPSENLYILDGLEIPNINHFGTQGATGGPISFINLDYVNETSFSTGGFSVVYGDKISSVLNIKLKKGRNDKYAGKATISATQFGLNLEGPVFSKNSNFIFSARRSYLDLIFKSAGFSFVPEYYDFLLKSEFELDNRNSISYIFISAFDNVKFFNDSPEKVYNNSRILGSDQIIYSTGLSFKRIFNNGFLNLTLGRNFNDFNSIQNDTLLIPIFKNNSREQENYIKLSLVKKLNSFIEIDFGLSTKWIKFYSDILFPKFITSFGDTILINKLSNKSQFYKGSSYLNLNFLLLSNLRTNIGVRLDYFNAIKDKFDISPRFSLRYKLSELLNLNFSTGLYYQPPSYIWLIGNEINKNLKRIKATQYIIGADYNVSEEALLKTEIFIKKYYNYPASLIRPYLVLANTGAGFGGSDDNFSSFGLEPLVSKGEGISRGIELSLQKKLSDIPYYGILSFTYSKTDFKALDGIIRSGFFDQRVIFNLSGGYKINNEWELSIKFRFATGRPYTPFTEDGRQQIELYNSRRLKSYHSLDLRVDKKWIFSNWSLITYIDIQNIYNYKNLTGIRYDPNERKVDESSSIGILPSIGISAEF